jgi:hypothetical protein
MGGTIDDPTGPLFTSPHYSYKLTALAHFHQNKCMENQIITGESSLRWIEQLAMEEINMDETGIIHMNEHLDPSLMLEESSIDFMNALRDRFEVYVTKFNELRGSTKAGANIKIFKISNTVNDFMLFRNSLRLVFSRKSNDVICISFLVNGKDMFAPRMSSDDFLGTQTAHEIRAHVGPFSNITWRYAGETVNINSLSKHYLSEFIRNSAR